MTDASHGSTDLPVGPLVDATPARTPERIVLDGRYVRLVPLDPSAHGDALFAGTCGAHNDALWLYLFDGPYDDRATFDRALRAKADSADPLQFAIVDATSATALGTAALMRIEPVHRVIEVGSIIYSPALQRTRGATEAMYLFARYVFETLGYRRYEWKCNALNAPSRRAARRLGFTFEGIFRQHMIMKGRNRDTAWFSMLDAEWPDRKARFEEWLRPENFDAAGCQRSPLAQELDARK
jgi:RimJ/RimL family protein N-acetyltransferase